MGPVYPFRDRRDDGKEPPRFVVISALRDDDGSLWQRVLDTRTNRTFLAARDDALAPKK